MKSEYKFYGKQKLPDLLTVQEEKELYLEIKNGKPKEKLDAKNKFITCNLRLVIKIARSYERLGMDLEDLVSEGNIGLIQAVERFNPEKGAKFSTYAGFWIRQKIMRALSNHGSMIRMPCYLKQIYLNYLKYVEAFQEEHDRKPTPKEASKKLNISVRKVNEMVEAGSAVISLDCKVGEDEKGDSYNEVIKDSRTQDPSEKAEEKSHVSEIHKILHELSTRERRILERRFGIDGDEPQTLEEIGKIFSVTRERIRQIERIALLKVKKIYRKKGKQHLDGKL